MAIQAEVGTQDTGIKAVVAAAYRETEIIDRDRIERNAKARRSRDSPTPTCGGSARRRST